MHTLNEHRARKSRKLLHDAKANDNGEQYCNYLPVLKDF